MQKLPAFKYFYLLLIGVLLGINIELDNYVCLVLAAIAILVLLLSIKFSFLRYAYPLMVAITGIVLVQNLDANRIVYPQKVIPDFNAYIKGKIVKVVLDKPNNSRYIVSGSMNSNVFTTIYDINVSLTVYGKSNSDKRFYLGDIIQANAFVSVPKSPQLSTDFDEVNYARSADIQFFCNTNYSNVSKVQRAEMFSQFFNQFRMNLQERIDLLFSTENAGIVRALLTGDRSHIPYETKRNFSLTGTAHVLAVSGLHVGVIAFSILLLLSFIRNRIIKFILFLLLLGSFIILTGFQPSTIRASTMAVLLYLVWLLQRRVNLLNVFSFAIVLILFIQPKLILNIGFQMSAGALLGISLLLETAKKTFFQLTGESNVIGKYVVGSLAVTLSVSVVVSPIIAYYFNFFSIISPLANLIVVPMITLVLVFSIIAIALSFVYMPAGEIYASASDGIFGLTDSIINFMSIFKFTAIESADIVWIAISISVLLILLITAKKKNVFYFRLTYSTISLVLIVLLFISRDNKTAEIRFYPREHLVVVMMPTDKGYVDFILDRKPGKFAKLDFELYNHYLENNDKRTLLVNGNNGLKLIDNLKKKKHVDALDITIDDIDEFSKYLPIDKYVFRAINY